MPAMLSITGGWLISGIILYISDGLNMILSTWSTIPLHIAYSNNKTPSKVIWLLRMSEARILLPDVPKLNRFGRAAP